MTLLLSLLILYRNNNDQLLGFYFLNKFLLLELFLLLQLFLFLGESSSACPFCLQDDNISSPRQGPSLLYLELRVLKTLNTTCPSEIWVSEGLTVYLT